MLPYVTKEKLNDMDLGLRGKAVIVTGGTAGIGRETAEYLLEQGCRVTITGRRENADETAKELEEKLGFLSEERVCIGVSGDIAEAEVREEILRKTLEVFGTVDALVNNAGINILASAEEVKEEDWDRVLSVNLKAAFFMAQEAGKYWIRENRPGNIVNVASQAGIIALDRHAAYCASKAGLAAATSVLALEWGRYGIRVNAVAPTIVLTELGHAAWDGPAGDAFKELMPSGRFAKPEEVASVIAFLLSDASSMITGQNLPIDGGYTIR